MTIGSPLSREYLIGAQQVGLDLVPLRQLNLNGLDEAQADPSQARSAGQAPWEADRKGAHGVLD